MWTGSPLTTRWPAAGNWVTTVPTEKLWAVGAAGAAVGGAGSVAGAAAEVVVVIAAAIAAGVETGATAEIAGSRIFLSPSC